MCRFRCSHLIRLPKQLEDGWEILCTQRSHSESSHFKITWNMKTFKIFFAPQNMQCGMWVQFNVWWDTSREPSKWKWASKPQHGTQETSAQLKLGVRVGGQKEASAGQVRDLGFTLKSNGNGHAACLRVWCVCVFTVRLTLWKDHYLDGGVEGNWNRVNLLGRYFSNSGKRRRLSGLGTRMGIRGKTTDLGLSLNQLLGPELRPSPSMELYSTVSVT